MIAADDVPDKMKVTVVGEDMEEFEMEFKAGDTIATIQQQVLRRAQKSPDEYQVVVTVRAALFSGNILAGIALKGTGRLHDGDCFCAAIKPGSASVARSTMTTTTTTISKLIKIDPRCCPIFKPDMDGDEMTTAWAKKSGK